MDSWSVFGKVAIVTGANTGIGKCTALELARKGCRVILACRNVAAADEACDDIRRELGMSEQEGERMVSWRYVDMSSMESVRKFVDDFTAAEPELHLLVNNAGVLPPDQRTMTKDGEFELTFATNHLGPFLLTNLLLPLLKKSQPARIVNVSSVGYKMCMKVGGYNIDDPQYEKQPDNYEPWMAYCQTKLANILMTRQLEKLLNGSGVTVYSCHPGMVKTDIFRHRSWKFNLLCGLIVHCFGRTPRRGAKAVVHCSTEPGLEPLSGSYFVDTKTEELEAIATDDSIGERLWQLSQQLSGFEATENGLNKL